MEIWARSTFWTRARLSSRSSGPSHPSRAKVSSSDWRTGRSSKSSSTSRGIPICSGRAKMHPHYAGDKWCCGSGECEQFVAPGNLFREIEAIGFDPRPGHGAGEPVVTLSAQLWDCRCDEQHLVHLARAMER